MIRIHRSKPLVYVGSARVSLTPDEHLLVTTLGMMDNRLVPHALLLEVMREHPVPIPADREALMLRMSRLKKKLGKSYLTCRRQLGYQLTGEVQFVG